LEEIMPGLWSETVFTALLKQGRWDGNADDKITGECLTVELVRDIVARYQAQPTDRGALQELGLVTLAMGVAQWGIENPTGLPADPAHNAWKSVTGPNSGKHLMSYSIGGVGISHADVGDLDKFIEAVASDTSIVPAEHAPGLLRLRDKTLYKKDSGTYDQIRGAGVCPAKSIDVDLNGKPFEHFTKVGVDANYCATYRNDALKATDWQVFRTWMRAALRTRPKQEWLANRWMEHYWEPSLKMVPPGPGYIDEVMVNVRVRNSSPAVANEALKRHATTVSERVRRELKEYELRKPSAFRRRCGLMLRPVVLYRHFAKQAPLEGVECPPLR